MSGSMRAFVVGSLLTLPVTAAGAAQAPPDVGLTWILTRGCELPSYLPPIVYEKRLECGRHGDFFLDLDPKSAGLFLWISDLCPPVAQGWEFVPTFPLPTGSAAPGAWLPCAQGRCLSPGGRSPWMAVIDWSTEHGWTVAQTALEASGRSVAVELLPLDRPNMSLPLLSQLPVGDVHMLSQLCALEERLEDGELPPLVANLSVGRHAAAVGPEPPDRPLIIVEVPGDGPPPSMPPMPGVPQPPVFMHIRAQVAAVVDHLRTEYDIAFVGADGHHRAPSFPASLPGVISAGLLDLSRLREGVVRRAWQTDGGTRALLPGNGVKLISDEEPSRCWSAPPGSSYAAAITAGWIAGYRARGGVWSQDWATAQWSVGLAGGVAHLTRDGGPVAGSELPAAAALVNRALSGFPCASGRAPRQVSLAVTGSAADPSRSRPSQPEALAMLGPAPGNTTCVPCEIVGGAGLRRTQAAASAELRVGLGATGAMPASQRIVDLFLMIDGSFFALGASNKPQVLSTLASGQATELTVTNLPQSAPGRELGLLFVVRSQGREFWTSTPINVLP